MKSLFPADKISFNTKTFNMRIQYFALCCLVLALQSPLAESAITSWTTPNISGDSGPGTLSIPESQTLTTTIETYVALTDATTVTYALNPAVAPFALSTTGVLTITANLDADKTPTYTLNIVATDNTANTPASGTATITVTVTKGTKPSFGSQKYEQCIADGSVIDTTLVTVLATDSDKSQTVTHSIASGNTNNDFKIGTATGVIQVANALSMSRTASYTLVINAVDNENPKKTGSTTVAVTVSAECNKNNAAINGVSIAFLLLSILTLLMI
ncbi:cadherin-23-like isoform X3 [Ruditapes philippinarum]|uniref:cadherin-23-like isoform X3 n=1 Tax=Ruditapes philippinarum TaxID=129788 RepID=UPI00295ADDB1|nr:cadherin-23-like isoform X3 [Ruditapes philippinarum]